MNSENVKSKSYALVLTALFAAIIVIMANTPMGYVPLIVINATIIHIPVIIGSLFLGPRKGAFLGFIFGFTSFLKSTFTATSLSAFIFSPIVAASVIGPSGVIKSTIICFAPRILVGVVPYFVYRGIAKLMAGKRPKLARIICDLIMSGIVFAAATAFLSKLMADKLTAIQVSLISLLLAIVVFIILELTLRKRSGVLLSYLYAGVSGALTNTLLVMPLIYIFYKDAYAKALSIDSSALAGVVLGIISSNGVIEALLAAIIVSAVGMALRNVVGQE